MKEIQLTRGKVALVDDEDYDRINQYKWCAILQKGIWYAHRRGRPGEPSVVRMSREIMNAVRDEVVDHIDHDGLNNQKVNLRICSQADNSKNRIRRASGVSYTSKYKGVHHRKDSGKWVAYIGARPKTHLGTFGTEEAAAAAYADASDELYGEFACHENTGVDYENVRCIAHPHKTSRYVGVDWDKRKSKWRAQIRVDGRNQFIGYFLDEDKASNEYQRIRELVKRGEWDG